MNLAELPTPEGPTKSELALAYARDRYASEASMRQEFRGQFISLQSLIVTVVAFVLAAVSFIAGAGSPFSVTEPSGAWWVLAVPTALSVLAAMGLLTVAGIVAFRGYQKAAQRVAMKHPDDYRLPISDRLTNRTAMLIDQVKAYSDTADLHAIDNDDLKEDVVTANNLVNWSVRLMIGLALMVFLAVAFHGHLGVSA